MEKAFIYALQCITRITAAHQNIDAILVLETEISRSKARV
jgi:hypothetical protein